MNDTICGDTRLRSLNVGKPRIAEPYERRTRGSVRKGRTAAIPRVRPVAKDQIFRNEVVWGRIVEFVGNRLIQRSPRAVAELLENRDALLVPYQLCHGVVLCVIHRLFQCGIGDARRSRRRASARARSGIVVTSATPPPPSSVSHQ